VSAFNGERPADQLVVMRDRFESLRWNVTAARDVLEERPDLLRARRAAEGEEQDGVGGMGQRADSSCTISTSACACATGVSGRIPCPS
jgi:hypothetical protein